MSEENSWVPNDPNEVVVPVGRAKLLTTKEEIDDALETASHIFSHKEDDTMENNEMNQELEISLNVDNSEATENNETTTETNETTGEELVELSADELAALPSARYGRDKYGRALNKDGTPRKVRNDKGKARGKYGPRKPKTDVTTVQEVSQTEAAAIVDSE